MARADRLNKRRREQRREQRRLQRRRAEPPCRALPHRLVEVRRLGGDRVGDGFPFGARLLERLLRLGDLCSELFGRREGEGGGEGDAAWVGMRRPWDAAAMGCGTERTLLPLCGSSTSFSILAMSELIMPLLLPSPPPPASDARGKAAACVALNFCRSLPLASSSAMALLYCSWA